MNLWKTGLCGLIVALAAAGVVADDPQAVLAQSATAQVLPIETPVYFELAESLTTRRAKPKKDAKAGFRSVNVNDLVRGTVVEDVIVGGVVLVEVGAEVQLRVGEGTKKNRRMGRKGVLVLEPKLTYAISGQRVALAGDLLAEGSSRTGATVVHTVLWGGLGLLKKGKAATIEADGTVYYAFTAAPVEVDLRR